MENGNPVQNRDYFTCMNSYLIVSSFGKLASHVGNGISIWLVAIVINKDLTRTIQPNHLEKNSFLTPP